MFFLRGGDYLNISVSPKAMGDKRRKMAKKKKNPLDDYLEELDKYEEGTEPREVEVDD
jgi:hypothetical protein